MTIIRPTLPAFWWLNPWAHARSCHQAANALRDHADRLDDLLTGEYSPRPRWQLLVESGSSGVLYYFHDTDPEYNRGMEVISVVVGKTLLYDGPSKYFVTEADPAKAIERLTTLNAPLRNLRDPA